MTLQSLALAALMARCAPNVAPSTMAAIVRVESSGDPLAIGDNTARRSYHPRSLSFAEALARRLLDVGHSLDLGLAQIDSIHFTGFGVNVHRIFDPCTNLNIGARIFSEDYGFAAGRYGGGQVALRHAIGMYNTGQLNGGQSYIHRVLAVVGIQEKHARQWIFSASDRRQSRLLAQARISDNKSPSSRHLAVTPSRAPILITITRSPGITVF